jgi:branched-chain amino acid aminotransferase
MIDFDIRPTDHPVPDAEREKLLEAPGFGQLFTDHMITLRWSTDSGWHDGRLEPYGPFTLDPATSVLHYSQEFFEGLKAYRQDNGSITMFRPDANAARFNSTARRNCRRRPSSGRSSCWWPRTASGSRAARGTASTCGRS